MLRRRLKGQGWQYSCSSMQMSLGLESLRNPGFLLTPQPSEAGTGALLQSLFTVRGMEAHP